MTKKDACAMVTNKNDLIEMFKGRDRVIALFHASWCPFCVRFLPIFQKFKEGKDRYFVIVQDDQETIAGQYSVKVYPSVLFFENGAVSKRLDGVLGAGLDETRLAKFVQSCPLPKS